MSKFSLGDSLAEVLKKVPDSGTGPGREQITYIPLADIDSDGNNFYSLEGIEDLAANIELVGLQQPLRVRANEGFPGRYILTSGHRRRAAIGILDREWYGLHPDTDADSPWSRVACIVEQPAGSDALQELRLIYANSDTRRMSSADLAKQAERVEALLYQLKEEGYEFPGRMRDHVAEACKVSKTKLGNLKVIRANAVEEVRQLWEAGTINESCALELARQEKDTQREILNMCGSEIGTITAEEIRVNAERVNGVLRLWCNDGFCYCEHAGTRLANFNMDPVLGKKCTKYCCKTCPALLDCATPCARSEEALNMRRKYAEQEKEREKANREAEWARAVAIDEQRREQRRAEKQMEHERGRRAWINLGRAAKEKGIDAAEALVTVGYINPTRDDALEAEALFDGVQLPEDMEGLLTVEPCFDDTEGLVNAVKVLDVSADFLLGLTDEPRPKPPEPSWIPGNQPPDRDRDAAAVFDCGGQSIRTLCCYISHLGHWFFGSVDTMGARIEAECLKYILLPEEKEETEDDESDED